MKQQEDKEKQQVLKSLWAPQRDPLEFEISRHRQASSILDIVPVKGIRIGTIMLSRII